MPNDQTQTQTQTQLTVIDPYSDLPIVADETSVVKAMQEINLDDTNSITRFGSSVSEQATMVSRQMLEGVRNKDTGLAGDVLNDMLLTVRGLDGSSLQGGGLFGWLKTKASRLASFAQQFEEVQDQVEALSASLKQHQQTLMNSVIMMDRLYDATEVQFHELDVYIIAGERTLKLVSDRIAVTQTTFEINDGSDKTLLVQRIRDLENKRDQLERKVHDLKLVRMVTLQALPKIRVTQDSDNNLISKIDTMLVTTIPLWYQNITMSLEVAKTQKAANAIVNVTEATEEMVVRGAEQFKIATLDARRAVERSVVGIEGVKVANELIIETLEEMSTIVDEGRTARAEADQVLISSEIALYEALNKMDSPSIENE